MFFSLSTRSATAAVSSPKKGVAAFFGTKRREQRRNPQRGVTLLEVMVAVLLLGIISGMIYSVLNVGISFSSKGNRQILAMEQKQGLLTLLYRQVTSAWYDVRQRKVIISVSDDLLKIITRSPLIYRDNGVVLAIYRYNDQDQSIYYTEKRDFYNIDYDEVYVPDFDEMRRLVTLTEPLTMSYDAEGGGGVSITYGDKQFEFVPKAQGRSNVPF